MHNVLHAPNKYSCLHSTEEQNVLHDNCSGRDFLTQQSHSIAYFLIYSSNNSSDGTIMSKSTLITTYLQIFIHGCLALCQIFIYLHPLLLCVGPLVGGRTE